MPPGPAVLPDKTREQRAGVAVAGPLLVTVRKRATAVAVEGQATNRTTYARVAASLGTAIQVQTFSAAHDALRWLKRRPVDLVIIDSWRLDLDGPGFLAVLRKHPASRNTLVIVLTIDQTSACATGCLTRAQPCSRMLLFPPLNCEPCSMTYFDRFVRCERALHARLLAKSRARSHPAALALRIDANPMQRARDLLRSFPGGLAPRSCSRGMLLRHLVSDIVLLVTYVTCRSPVTRKQMRRARQPFVLAREPVMIETWNA